MKQFLFRIGILLLCICLLFVGAKAFAGTITLRMQATLTIAAGRIEVRITTTNLGTEPARDLQAFLHIFDRSLESGTTPRLDAGQTRSFFFHLPVPSENRGRFAFIAEALYHDANQKPFSALACDVFHLKHKAISELTGHVSELTIKGNSKLPVLISNPGLQSLSCTATLYLPRGLTTPVNLHRFVLDPKQETTIEFKIFDSYETESAVYPIFCILEYEEDGVHYSKIVRSTVRIKKLENWFKKTKWFWLGGLIPIVLMWLGVLLLRQKRTDNPG